MLLKLFQYPQTNKFQSVPVPPIQKFQTVPEILILTELFQYPPPPLPKNLKRFQYPLNPPPPPPLKHSKLFQIGFKNPYINQTLPKIFVLTKLFQ